MTDSEEFRQQLDSLQADRSELQAKLTVAEKRLVEVAEMESASRDRLSEISRITGQRTRFTSKLGLVRRDLPAADD